MRPSPASGSTPSPSGGLESLCDRQQLLSDWTRLTNLPKPPLEFQGTETLLKHQYKLCSNGQIGFIQTKHIVSALPELEEGPLRTRRKVTVDGWEREDEEEERKVPSSQRLLDRTHQVFRNNLAMCVLAFLQLSHSLMPASMTLMSGMLGFGAQISRAGPRSRVIAPCSLQSGMHGETSTNLMYEGSTLKGAMKEDLLFWQREGARNTPKGMQFCRAYHVKKSCPGNCGRSHNCPVMKNGWICDAPSARRRLLSPQSGQPGPSPTTLGRTLAQVLVGALSAWLEMRWILFSVPSRKPALGPSSCPLGSY